MQCFLLQPWPHNEPGGSVRGERANFTRLVLGCIEAKFRKEILVRIAICFEKKIEKKELVGKLSPRSTQCTPLHRFRIRTDSEVEKSLKEHPVDPNRGEERTLLAQTTQRKYEKNERRSINSLSNTSAKISCAEKKAA